MIRLLFRLVILVVLLAAAAMFFLGWRPAGLRETLGDPPIDRIDTAKAREVGAQIGAKASEAAAAAQTTLSEGSVTAKIKAKMSLDDSVQAKDINVDFASGVVKLTGTVRTAAERKRAVDLARETAGVSSVDDQLRVVDR
jgi:osmotically-inducible protein OsmY